MTELNSDLLEDAGKAFWAISAGANADATVQTLAKRHSTTVDRVLDVFGLWFEMEIIRDLYGPDPSPAPPEIMKLIRQSKRRETARPKAPKQTHKTALSLDSRSWQMWKEALKK